MDSLNVVIFMFLWGWCVISWVVVMIYFYIVDWMWRNKYVNIVGSYYGGSLNLWGVFIDWNKLK